MVADWEYGMQVAHWDDLLAPEEFVSPLKAFHSINGNNNVVSFNWCYFMIGATYKSLSKEWLLNV